MKRPMSVPRARLAVAAVDGKVYVFGGESPRSALPTAVPETGSRPIIFADGGMPRAFETLVEQYDPATNAWSAKAPKPTGVSNIGAGVIGGSIYVPGGYNGSSAVAVLEAYNPVTNTWSTQAPMPAAQDQAAVAAVGDKLYVLGGVDSDGYVLKTCYVYDQPTNTWSTCAPMAQARYLAPAGVVNGKIYIVGGASGLSINLSSVERYDPAANTWVTVAPLLTPRGRGRGRVRRTPVRVRRWMDELPQDL